MSTISTTKMTAQQFLELGEDPVGVRLELVNGEVAVSPSATPNHSYTEKILTTIMVNHVRSKKLGRLYGDVDTMFGRYNVRRPDLIFFFNSRLNLVGETAMKGPPDLCVEIVSPSSRLIDRRDKFKQYAKGKVAHYWIIDPEDRTAEAFELARGAYRPAGSGKNDEVVKFPPFLDLKIPLGEIWEPERPKPSIKRNS
ncbi:MAG TPA: Uma2 family endonuclease [Tepidisphaeraceae bacterium]|jgi:Uma2 family endonuclease|nr:Uma2 family endonuclease [Tepidisphaeraceae bacterium]